MNPRMQEGFSLLEVLVAFSILALSLGILIQIFSRAMTATALSGAYQRAITLAENKLSSVGLEIPLELSTESGETEDGFFWQVVIEDYPLPDTSWETASSLYEIRAQVSWKTAEGTRQIVLRSLRLAPKSESP